MPDQILYTGMKREKGFYWIKVKTLLEPCIAKWNGWMWEIPGFFTQIPEEANEWVKEEKIIYKL